MPRADSSRPASDSARPPGSGGSWYPTSAFSAALVGISFGLAMDDQLFLTSGMREAYVHGPLARLAVAQGFRAGPTASPPDVDVEGAALERRHAVH